MDNGLSMEPAQYAAFLGVSLLVICTPGQDTALTIRNTLAGGRRAGVATAIGVSAGQAAWTVAAATGLVFILAASEPLFFTVRLAGAAYLVYLGARSLLRAAGRESVALESAAGRAITVRAAAAQGLFSDLSNAKMVAFFVGLLPPFAGVHPNLTLLLVLGFNFALLTLAWLCAYAHAVDRMRTWFRIPNVRRALDVALGVVLVGLGLRVTREALAR